MKLDAKKALAVGLLSLAHAALPSCGKSTEEVQDNTPRSGVDRGVASPIAMGHAWSELIPQERHGEFLSVINTALTLVRQFQPEGDNPFSWRGGNPQGKEFQLFFTTSQDPAMSALTARVPGGIFKNTDAFTISIQDPDSAKTLISTVLLLDRLFYKKDMSEREDALARTAVVLAHELYGNVTESLSRTPEQLKTPQTAAQRKASEVNAFQAGIDFLERLEKDRFFQSLPPKLQQDFKQLLVEERRALESWKR